MCGRYARVHSLTDFIAPLGVDLPRDRVHRLKQRDAGPRYNVAPGTKGWIALLDVDGDLAIDQHKWTFPTSRGTRINVRSETAHRVPEYREPFDRHRCVVLASGFYEPKGPKTIKNCPWYFFRPEDESPLFLGAVVKPEGFSILTRAPVEPVASGHDRSPIIIPADNFLAWLAPNVPGRDALREFAPANVGLSLVGWRVGDGAKRAANEVRDLIEPARTTAEDVAV